MIHPIDMFVPLGNAPSALGEYKGSDALTKKIVAKKGATDSASLKEYGAIVGAAGAGGACAAFAVTAPFAGGCAILGGLIGGALAAAIPIAKGSDIYDLVIDTWNNEIKAYVTSAPSGILAIKTYLVMRDKFILDSGGSASQVEAFLVSHGLPGAPVRARWAPNPVRAQAAAEFDVWTIPGNSSIGNEAQAAEKVYGVDRKLYLLLRDHMAPPIASMKDQIDWGLVGYDEVLVVNKYGANDPKGKAKGTVTAGVCDIRLASNWTAWGKTQLPYPYPALPRTCPTEQPTKVAAELIAKLEQTKYAPSSTGDWLPRRPLASTGSTVVKGTAIVAGAAVVAGVGLAIWKPALFTALKKAVGL